jgi:hypothetical protein
MHVRGRVPRSMPAQYCLHGAQRTEALAGQQTAVDHCTARRSAVWSCTPREARANERYWRIKVSYTINLLQCFVAQYRRDVGIECEPEAAVWSRLASAAGHALAGHVVPDTRGTQR